MQQDWCNQALARLKHDDRHAGQRHRDAGGVPVRRPHTIHRPQSEDGDTDINAAIGGIDPAGAVVCKVSSHENSVSVDT